MDSVIDILYNAWIEKRSLGEIRDFLSYLESEKHRLITDSDEWAGNLWKNLLETEKRAYITGFQQGAILIMELMKRGDKWC